MYAHLEVLAVLVPVPKMYLELWSSFFYLIFWLRLMIFPRENTCFQLLCDAKTGASLFCRMRCWWWAWLAEFSFPVVFSLSCVFRLQIGGETPLMLFRYLAPKGKLHVVPWTWKFQFCVFLPIFWVMAAVEMLTLLTRVKLGSQKSSMTKSSE